MATRSSVLAWKIPWTEEPGGLLSAAAAKSLQSCRALCDPIDSTHQASPSLGFSRQEHWSGLPFPSPTRESEVAQSCPTLRDPVDCSDSPSIRSLFGTLCYSPRSSVCPGTTPGANAHLKRPVRWPFCLEHSLPK